MLSDVCMYVLYIIYLLVEIQTALIEQMPVVRITTLRRRFLVLAL